jgi:hypothetical protein
MARVFERWLNGRPFAKKAANGHAKTCAVHERRNHTPSTNEGSESNSSPIIFKILIMSRRCGQTCSHWPQAAQSDVYGIVEVVQNGLAWHAKARPESGSNLNN